MNDKKYTKRNQSNSNSDMVNLVNNLDQKTDLKYNRRAFLKTAAGASVALGVATLPLSVRTLVGAFEDDSDHVEIVKLSELPKGSSVKFNYPTEEDSALLVHTKSGELKAYNNACTHLMCPVFYEEKEEVLLCPCHKGYFDLNNGQPIAGPPQRELPLIEVEVINGVVYAVDRKYRHG
ncbi:ubiquinol-cytochrome c reductase iron-sulfur subunit [Alteribacillus bidgolensis]|uniref:Tat (Twin-arginine translocation) pathway signal sequence n=1 Tax=Alteribacillus bidgolensis TaxID=930129 RepID=A0A1G8CKH6_9BACI|nr:Rieske (2Fe-2S) protein [Alteribacillus bidgolensis]SDH45935.1 Tat (twin-arginine translocation) pathway signal sequence [Alteribacillus bidgolensis]